MTERENKDQLPKDWKWVKLGDVCEKMSNGANVKQSEEKIGFPISRIETIWNETIDLGRVKYIQENDPVFVEKYSLRKDDILFSHINSDIHLGKTAIFKNQTKTLIHGINLLLIRLNQEVIPDFFNYQFKYKRRNGEFISIAQKSVNQSSINQPKLKNVDFVLPPKPTQLAIVSKIEELFSELDKGIESLLTAKQQLKTYQQSVLKWAFEGKLTNGLNHDSFNLHVEHNFSVADEPEVDYKTAKNQVDQDNPLNQSSDKGKLSKGWKWVKLGEVIEKPKYGTSKKCDYETIGLGVLRIPNIVKGVVDSSDLKFANFDEREIDIYNLKEGDILIIRSNGSVDIVGKCALITKEDEEFLYAGYLIRLRPLLGFVSPKYLFNILSSIDLRNQIERKAKSTSGVNNINSQELSGLIVPLPPIEEQHLIVKAIESRLSVADKMEEDIIKSLKQAEALKQSILKKVFEGRLA